DSPVVDFFFSSRRRHTSFSRDWSSDVYSSDLDKTCKVCRGIIYHVRCSADAEPSTKRPSNVRHYGNYCRHLCSAGKHYLASCIRSEERRVGKECRQRWGGPAGKERGAQHGGTR